MDTRVFRGADLGTDHFLVVSRLRGLFAGWRHRPKCPEPQAATRTRSWKLQDAEIRDKYRKDVSSKLTCLPENVTEDIEECWQSLRESMLLVAKETCGTTKGRKIKTGDPWWDDEVKEAVSLKKKKWCDYLASSDSDVSMRDKSKEAYRLQKKRTKEMIEDKRERFQITLDSKMSNNFKENSKLFWREVRNTRNSSTFSRMNVISDFNKNILTDKTDILRRWSEFYRDMYDCNLSGPMNTEPPFIPGIGQTDEDKISMKEIERAIRSLKCGKSAGIDEVTAEMIKYGGPVVWDMFYLLCNLCWQRGDVPDDWRRAVIVPFYKGKGSRMDCTSYRAISLISIACKVYAKILTIRVQEKIERKLWEAQGGFRAGRGCSDQIFSLRNIVEKFLAVDQKVFCAFVDLEKAFDRVVRKELWDILPRYGVDGVLLRALRSLYDGHKACVRVGGDVSPWFDVLSGVKQGCVMSASLFIAYLDSCLSNLKVSKCGLKMGELVVNCLLYADDAVLLASSKSELQTLVSTMKEDCEKKGLHLNASKTKVLVFERDEQKTPCDIRVNGQSLEQVNEIVYLGSMFTRDGRCGMDIERRVTAGNRVNGAMGALMKSKNITNSARLAVHNALLVPTLLYGSESWVCQKNHESRLNAVEMRSLRKMCGVTLADRIRNEDIRSMTGLSESIINKMKIGMLRWFGHAERMSEERMTKQIYYANVCDSRGRGRPRHTYHDQIKRVLNEGNVKSTRNRRKCMRILMKVDEAKEVCKDRVLWRSILSAYPGRDSA